MRVLWILLAASVATAQEPSADCAFEAMRLRSPRETYHQLSTRTELVAPSAVASAPGRRRPSQPPKGSTPPAPRSFIDSEIFGKMVKDGVPWTNPSSDTEFLRRVTLDLTGEIPDAATVKAFLADTDEAKRDEAIDRLLASDAFADRWTMWFGDHVQNVQFAQNVFLGGAARNAYNHYIHDAFASGKPYDAMVRELIAGVGDNEKNGEVNYLLRQLQGNGPLQDTYDNLAAFTGQKFLGLPLVCLSCHGGLGHLEQVNTGMVKRTRRDFWQMAAFFTQYSRQRLSFETPHSVVSDVFEGDYMLNTDFGNKTPRIPGPDGATTVGPAFFLTGEMPAAGEPRRAALARMVTAHPQFARAAVNYLWKEMFGMGLVEPVDSFDLLRQDAATLPSGATLQPTHPKLLDQLAESFRASGYDVRALLRLIARSNAYQLSTAYAPGGWNESWTPYYARHYARRLMAEEVLDAIARATNVRGTRKAMQFVDTTDGGPEAPFLNAFGRGNRDDAERKDDGSILQSLEMLNDRIVTDRVNVNATGSLVQTLVKNNASPEAIADALYLATLSRYPTAKEKATAVAYLGSGALAPKTEDLQFALLNKIEFLFH